MKIVVTGYKGYVGSALFANLERVGFKPVGFDKVDGPEGDITDSAVCDKIAELGPDIIYNMAGLSGEEACRADPEQSDKINRYAPFRLRVWCSGLLIQASSASVLGNGVYAEDKRKAEWLLFDKLPTIRPKTFVLRFGTVVGYNFDGPTRWTTPANSMVRSAVRERKIVVNGPGLMRPWVTLSVLVKYLTRFATHPPKTGYDGPIPVAQENMSLGEMARLVGLYRPGCEKVYNPPGEDARDYEMPALLGGSVNEAMRHLVEHA